MTLDIVMPQMDGVQTLRSLHGLHPGTRVVMVTAMTSLAKVQECARFGASHYIIKPFDEPKVRDDLAGTDDPGWYRQPLGSLSRPATGAESALARTRPAFVYSPVPHEHPR